MNTFTDFGDHFFIQESDHSNTPSVVNSTRVTEINHILESLRLKKIIEITTAFQDSNMCLGSFSSFFFSSERNPINQNQTPIVHLKSSAGKFVETVPRFPPALTFHQTEL